MQKGSLVNCKLHHGQKLRKFCMKPECWIKVCPKCASDKHKGHKVVDRAVLSQEAKVANNKLFQVKKSELVLIGQFIESTVNLRAQLKDMHEKRRNEIKAIESDLLAKMQKINRSEELKVTELENKMTTLEDKLKELHRAQTKEAERIPELASAVITKGTIDDLKTFFEMCQKGVEVNNELLEYKKKIDEIKENIEDYIIINPVNFLFEIGVLRDQDSINSSSKPNLTLPQPTEEIMNNSLNDLEQLTPLQRVNSSFMSIKKSEEKKAFHKVKSSLGLCSKKMSVSEPKPLTNNIITPWNVNITRSTSQSNNISKTTLKRNSDKALTRSIDNQRCVSALKTKGVSHNKNKLLATARKSTINKKISNKSVFNCKLIKIQTITTTLKTELSVLSSGISKHFEYFSNGLNEIKKLSKCITINKRLTECIEKCKEEYKNTLCKFQFINLGSLSEKITRHSTTIQKYLINLLRKKANNREPLAIANDLLNISINPVNKYELVKVKDEFKEYKDLYKKHKKTLEQVNVLSEKVKELQKKIKEIKSESITSLFKSTAKYYDKTFKKLFIKCYGIIKKLKRNKSSNFIKGSLSDKRENALQIITSTSIDYGRKTETNCNIEGISVEENISFISR